MYRSLPRLLLIPILCVLLQGCSAVRLGYGNADSLARWWIDQYVDLSPEQDGLVRERLLRFHAWHRKTQLPDYAELLRQGRAFATGQPTAKDALALSEGIIRRGRTMADQAAPDIADFLASIGPAQIERMSARFAEKNADFAKEAKLGENEAAQRTVRYKRLLERAEYWFGDFNDTQQAALRQLVEGQNPGTRFWYDERLRRQREWLDLVRKVQSERPPRERTIQRLRDYAAGFDLPVDPARLPQALALRRASADLAVAIHALTTPAQRAHAQQRIDDLIRDLTELSQEI
jgi:hypothetical protein